MIDLFWRGDLLTEISPESEGYDSFQVIIVSSQTFLVDLSISLVTGYLEL